ncbi:OmpH family outer membrane protein [candidate division KSB1 bacterium]|nr:OmpH family outer membrane protein [candidate division KSB1 bacterium]
MVKSKIHFLMITLILGLGFSPAFAQLKLGYVNSQQVLEKFKDALDVKKQLAELNTQWESEARNMQREIQKLQEELESQSLLLSDQRRQEKVQEIQTLGQKYQLFLQTKWGQQGEGVKKEVELLQPVYEKINTAIKKIGEAEGYQYIFDVVAGNILYASDDQPDLTEKLLAELNKELAASTTDSK